MRVSLPSGKASKALPFGPAKGAALPAATGPYAQGVPLRQPSAAGTERFFFIRRTGCQGKAWQATKICSGGPAPSRFQERMPAGVFARLWAVALKYYEVLRMPEVGGHNTIGATRSRFPAAGQSWV